MNKHLKSLLIVTPICLALAGLSVLLYLIDPNFAPTADILVSMILVTVWAFFIVPSIPFAIRHAKNYFSKMDFRRGFHFGYLLGCGWGVMIFIIILFVSPITGTLWFADTIKSAVKDSHREKEITDDTPNIFDQL
ncbi:MAG: hypothetical protein NC037_01265 [Bacteroides sp.]|nr:hypothetical protein [Bacillota bacterium]MCM1393947.1 hypothetical protein [[Eubacterium] siraeum]MCM1455145.1 hypothetical protein [Bacteroides sp.]